MFDDEAPQPPPAYVAAAPAQRPIVLPPRLPADCFMKSAADYALPATILLAIVKVESQGRVVIRRNENGSLDYGVAQLNSGSWAKYMQERYGISTQALTYNVCQAVRAMAYVLRTETNHSVCKGDIWCGVGRYHAPNNPAARSVYVPKVRAALSHIETTRRFE